MEILDPVNTKIRTEYFNSIFDIDVSTWNAVTPQATGLHHNLLGIFELSGVNDLSCHYLLFKQNEKPVGKANLYEVAMDFTSLDKNLASTTRKLIKIWHPEYLNLSMAECGLFAMNGDGIATNDISLLPDIIASVDQHLVKIATLKSRDLVVFRDIPLEHYEIYERLLVPLGYSPAAGFTNAVIDIEWESIESYLNSLNSKDRHKLKTALKIEQNFDIRIGTTSSYKDLAKEMAQLWANVNASSDDYNREQLDEAFFYEAGLRLKNTSEAILFYHQEKLVAFMWNLIGTEDYHMADWGVDYNFPSYREANFYRAASLISLKRAIELGKKRMQLGMTNYTPKKLLGARMQPLVYFIKNIRTPEFTPTIARMITDAIEQPSVLDYYLTTPWHLPSMSDSEYKAIINSKIMAYPEGDALSQTETNYDINILKLGGLYSFYPDTDIAELNLASGYFFNFGKHPDVVSAGVTALQRAGATNNAAPFFSGCSSLAITVQEKIARLCNKESAQLLSSGSLIYNTALPPLLNSDSLVILDEQSNPLIWDAIAIAGCEFQAYSHNDMNDLESILQNNPDRKKLIITESVFPLFGDCANLMAIVTLKNKYKARLCVDESIAFGFFGNPDTSTEGLSAQLNLSDEIDIILAATHSGTGIDAGFVTSATGVIDHIRHQAATLLFSGNLSTFNLSTLDTALDLIATDMNLRPALIDRAEKFAESIATMGFQVIYCQLPIINLVFNDFTLLLAVQKKLLNCGIVTAAIGQPLLPPEMSVLRLTLHSDISDLQTRYLLEQFQSIAYDIKSSDQAEGSRPL